MTMTLRESLRAAQKENERLKAELSRWPENLKVAATQDAADEAARAEAAEQRVKELEAEVKVKCGDHLATIAYYVKERDALAAQLRQVREALAERQTWRPIETAPHDRELWLFSPQAERLYPQSKGMSSGHFIERVDGRDCWSVPYQPTHWMPLPEAPRTHP